MNKNNFNYYKAMDWYKLLGFDNNERSKRMRQGKHWTTEEIEKNYQNCLVLLNRSNLTEINSFYEKQLPNEKLENLSELREKIQLAHDTLINPEKRKEYDLEVFGIFYYDYPADEMADEKFKLKAIELLEDFLQDEWDKKLGHSYWVNYLSGYWKNWQETVKNTKYKEEIRFLVHRFHELRMFILKTTGWGKEKDQKYVLENASELIEQEKIRLQNISKEEWDKWIEKSKMSEEDIEWVASEVEKFLKGENANSQSPSSTSEELAKIKKWMEENNVEEVILRGRNEVICKKCNGSGSLSFGGDFVPRSSDKGLPELPEGSRVKIAGVDMGLFFQKLGKNSITKAELTINEPDKLNQKKANTTYPSYFSQIFPWMVVSVVMSSLIIIYFLVTGGKKRKK